MLASFSCFLLSFFLTAFFIRYRNLHDHLSADTDFSSPQKFHTKAVPRIGGLAIFLGLVLASLLRYFSDPPSALFLLILLGCSLPAFVFGLIEDLTKQISPRIRLLACFGSAILASYFLGASLRSLALPGLDFLLQYPVISITLTCLMIAGLTNAYNIIDGFNGLACMVGMISLAAIAYVAFRSNDSLLLFMAVAMIGAVLGFFIWNYPKGLIFLGDGGAYFIGFSIGVLSILLVVRNAAVSPWFAALINIYPIFETIFSIWRKKFIKKMSPGVPDGVHLHMLIYGRIARWVDPGNSNALLSNNARTSPFLWVFSGLAVFPATIWWHNTIALQILTLAFCVFYIYIYRSIVLFKIPRWLKQ
ncbi:glycosyl transferase [Polynucleobacter paneuropaeus]|jgi:UDP-N-acetylmuramyl pentapeptide phosphotransferase/UDP-N-acetylglucosamine-1-phosphate transferase|uniref:Glycosyl transferase n=1 Tax=Polynucleobacter paneuropaeus TaxID=2527775 RepID=A0AAE2YLY3_9BURK|nr:glycosyltransferase [Polynucleobacter paneuropaeus]MBT8534580.1 glycosyl transferase [Polynucleobacter paneuropaeus]MBT8545277.1 glycosyl transferase [Polynucleobacter paneuropaeus]MBT8547945.1 glycosyl transferase [Polynucleobacter paneuropaeus]MBT8556445.1 glycosyl transferase [Polynucleobacter paneuropaeus]MBT8588798.1 glycosyl transferase [Polynucleobacter paneuropaeus]